MDASSLHKVLTSGHIPSQGAALSQFKAEIKKGWVDLSQTTAYFEALALASASDQPSVQSLAFSCTCHLIKRVVIQSPAHLQAPAPLVLPLILQKFADPKPSVRSTAKHVLEDYWLSCPAETEASLVSQGLANPEPQVRLGCLDLLLERVESLEAKFSFRPFTAAVCACLADPEPVVSERALQLLSLFFRLAHDRAKLDLYSELHKHKTPVDIAKTVLANIGLDASYPSADLATRKTRSLGSRPSDSKPSNPRPDMSSKVAPFGENRAGSVPTSNSAPSSILGLSIITDSPAFVVDVLKDEHISSQTDLQAIVEAMAVPFSGKESEFNWAQRDKAISRLRYIVRGNTGREMPQDMVWALKYLSEGITKAVVSLRTTLSSNACNLVKDCAVILGSNMDPVVEPSLTHLVKMSASTKRISHTLASTVINVLIVQTSFSMRYLHHISQLMADKAVQPKIYAGMWLRLLIAKHHRQASALENSGARESMEKFIVKGLNDPNPGVREAMRLAFWAYHEVWPREGAQVMAKLDTSIKRALDRANPNNGIEPQPHAIPQSHAPAPLFSSANFAAPAANPVRKLRPPIREFIRSRRSIDRPHVPVPRASLRSSLEPDLEPESPDVQAVVTKPSLYDLLNSGSREKLTLGLRIVAYMLQGRDVDSMDLACQSPVTMPKQDVVAKVLTRVFTRDSGQYRFKPQVRVLVQPSVVSKTQSYVALDLVIPAVMACLESDMSLSLRKLEGDPRDVFDNCLSNLETYDLLPQKVEAVLGFLSEIYTPSMKQRLDLFATRIAQLDRDVHDMCLAFVDNVQQDSVQENTAPEVIGTLSADLDKLNTGNDGLDTSTGLADLFAGLGRDSIANANLAASTPLASVKAAPKTPTVLGMTPKTPTPKTRDAHTKATPVLGMNTAGATPGVVAITPAETMNNGTSTAEPAEISTDSSTGATSVKTGINTELSAELNTEELADMSFGAAADANAEAAASIDETYRNEASAVSPVDSRTPEKENSPVSDTPRPVLRESVNLTDTGQNSEAKDSFDQKNGSDECEHSPEAASPEIASERVSTQFFSATGSLHASHASHISMSDSECSVDTTAKSGASVLEDHSLSSQSSVSWYSLEQGKLGVVPVDVLTTDVGALLEAVDSDRVSNVQFRQLVSVTRSGDVAPQTLAALAGSVVQFLSRASDATLINEALLLLNQLLESHTREFAGLEPAVYEALVSVAGSSSLPRTVLLGGLKETVDSLAKLCEAVKDSWERLMDHVMESTAKATLNRDQRTLAIRLLSMLINCTHTGPEDVAPRLQGLARTITTSIGDSETAVRKEMYAVLIALKRVMVEPADEQLLNAEVVSHLQVNQRRLLEYYWSKQ